MSQEVDELLRLAEARRQEYLRKSAALAVGRANQAVADAQYRLSHGSHIMPMPVAPGPSVQQGFRESVVPSQAYYAPRAFFSDDSRVDGNRYEFRSVPENPAHTLWLKMLSQLAPAKRDGYSEQFEAQSNIPIRERR